MIEFNDPFGRVTLIEILISEYNGRIGFVIRKERQSIYESWDLATSRSLVNSLQNAIKTLEEGDK